MGQLSQFYNLETGAVPKIDAAIAQAVTGAVDSTGNILFLGATIDANNVPLAGAPHAGLGISPNAALLSPHNGLVAKSGRTTGLTCSTISSIATNASVQYFKGVGQPRLSM